MKKISTLLLTAFVLFAPITTMAAALIAESEKPEYGVGQVFEVDILLDANNLPINAVEAEISYPANIVEFVGFETGNSVIVHWVHPPQHTNGQLKFSGIIPGGFDGLIDALIHPRLLPGPIVRIKFKSLQAGKGDIRFYNARVLLNDGLGTEAPLTAEPYDIKIGSYTEIMDKEVSEVSIPEFISAELLKDNSQFDGKYFLVFQASDKNYGISHFEIKEGNRRWVKSESPYILKDQRVGGDIQIKAVNFNGDESIHTIAELEKNNIKYAQAIVSIILLLALIAIVAYYIRKRR